ncbi:MAG: ATP-binding protein [bacterium]
MNKEYLKNVIIDQQKDILEKIMNTNVISREGADRCERYIRYPNVLLITGLRRAGKSFFASQLVKNKKYAYLNFDDERLIEFNIQDFNLILECFYELYPDFEYLLFDEIQNVGGWELFVSRLRDKYKIIITGSNANLLSKEMATHLTGRYSDFVLFPMSFREYLDYNNVGIISSYSTTERSKITSFFDRYVKESSIFDYYKFGKEFLRNLWASVIVKDITIRYKIKYPSVLEKLSVMLINYFTSKISISNLTRNLKVKSPNTVAEYIRYLENSFLVFTLNKFSYKIKEQLSTFKKIYIMDNGFINAMIFNFSENRGKLLENIVAIELKRRSIRDDFEIFYWNNYYVECDFIIKKGKQVISAYQVCSELNINNKEREISGLTAVMKEFDLKNGTILTESMEDEISINSSKIQVTPVWKWLLSEFSMVSENNSNSEIYADLVSKRDFLQRAKCKTRL